MFISNAHAQAAAGGTEQQLLGFLPIILMFAVLYFLMIRPQMKRAKEQKQMIDGLAKGDEVITAGGIVATSAPSLAACRTWTGWRTLATRISVSKA